MYSTPQSPPLMSRSLYKDTLDFLIRCSTIEVEGNHLRRLQLMAAMVGSCMRTKHCSLEGISRQEGEDERQSESRVKQAKRWLMSKWTDWETFFAPYIAPLLGQMARSGQLVFIIDGTETGQGCATLMLSVVWKNYAIPVVWMTREGEKGHFTDAQHTDLVRKCLSLLPTSGQFRVVLLGDGEFDGQSLRELCWDNNWEFVLRTSLDRRVDVGGETARIDSLLPLLDSQRIVFIENGCGRDNALLWKDKGFKDPIPLLTNMDLGAMACRYYRYRFKIETMFKQMKSAGFHLHKSMLANPQRICNLMLVLAIAFIFTFCVGLLIKECDKAVLAPITRADRVSSMGLITLAQKAFAHLTDLAYYLFYNLAKNFVTFLSS